jgi:hypothetical protein
MGNYQVTVGEGVQLGIAPTFHGFHPVWASRSFQVDVCNNVDDVIIRDEDGTLYRVPITEEFLPELGRMIEDMISYDVQTLSPWAEHNQKVRLSLLGAATSRVQGAKPQSLNIFEPGVAAPCLDGPVPAVDMVLARLIELSGDTRIPGQ